MSDSVNVTVAWMTGKSHSEYRMPYETAQQLMADVKTQDWVSWKSIKRHNRRLGSSYDHEPHIITTEVTVRADEIMAISIITDKIEDHLR